MLGRGIISSAVKGSVESVTITDVNSSATLNGITAGRSYSIVFKGEKDIKPVSYTSYVIDENGQPHNEQSGKLSEEGAAACPVSNAGLSKKHIFFTSGSRARRRVRSTILLYLLV